MVMASAVVIRVPGQLLIHAPLASCVHSQVTMGYGTVFIAFMWVYASFTGRWVYRALNWSGRLAPLYYLALPLLLVFGHALVKGLRDEKDCSHRTTDMKLTNLSPHPTYLFVLQVCGRSCTKLSAF